MAIKINYSQSNLSKNLEKMGAKLGAVLLMYSSTKAQEIEARAKSERPWVDRTGMAKATLNAKVSRPDDSHIRITLAHGVEYGIWLELANEKNYAIIGPVIRDESQKFVADLDNLMTKLKF